MGWECPKCGRCYNPSVLCCSACGQLFVVTVVPPCIVAPLCVHEMDEDSTVQRCKKCGVVVTVFSPGVTFTSITVQ